MSKNILSDFKSYNDYKNSVILPLNKKNLSEIEVTKEFSKSDDAIEEISTIYQEKTIKNIQTKVDENYEKKSSEKNSYESSIEDIRNKILAFANLSKPKKEIIDTNCQTKEPRINTPTPKIVTNTVSSDKDKLKSEALFSKLGEVSTASIKKETTKIVPEITVNKQIVQEIHLSEELVNKRTPQENNNLSEHKVWQKCTDINTEEAYVEYITLYPKGIYHIAAEYRIKGIIKIY